MTILKSTYQASNMNQNNLLYEFTITVDEELDATTVGSVLPNNGTKYRTVDTIGQIPTGSSATIYSPLNMYVCSFIAEDGLVNVDTGYQEGTWKILAKVAFK